MIEAPAVTLAGNVVANGGAGSSATGSAGLGEDGRLDAQPAQGGTPPDDKSYNGIVFAGHGGGGVGRIRINARSGGLTQSGIVSPMASVGAISVR